MCAHAYECSTLSGCARLCRRVCVGASLCVRALVAMVSALDQRTDDGLIIERSKSEACIRNIIKNALFRYTIWQIALQHVITVHPAVNRCLSHETDIEKLYV